MESGLIVFIALTVVGAVAVWISFSVIRLPLRDLMSRVVGIESATRFYERILILGLLYLGLATVFNAGGDVSKNPNVMTYVWKIAGQLDNVLGWMIGFLALYLVLITIIIASYRRGHER
jgi:hypothetical protein